MNQMNTQKNRMGHGMVNWWKTKSNNEMINRLCNRFEQTWGGVEVQLFPVGVPSNGWRMTNRLGVPSVYPVGVSRRKSSCFPSEVQLFPVGVSRRVSRRCPSTTNRWVNEWPMECKIKLNNEMTSRLSSRSNARMSIRFHYEWVPDWRHWFIMFNLSNEYGQPNG